MNLQISDQQKLKNAVSFVNWEYRHVVLQHKWGMQQEICLNNTSIYAQCYTIKYANTMRNQERGNEMRKKGKKK